MKNKDIKISSNRSFGIVFSVVFFLISFYPLYKGGELIIWSLVLGLVFLILGLIIFSQGSAIAPFIYTIF